MCLNFIRGTETEEQIQKRLRNAKEELELGRSSGIFDHILVNDDLENCYARLKVTNCISLSFPLSTESVEWIPYVSNYFV